MEDLIPRLRAKFAEHRSSSEEYAVENLMAEIEAAGYQVTRKSTPVPPLFETHPVGNGTVTFHWAYRKDWAAN